MAKAKVGDKVKVHYSGSLKSGSIFDSSLEREPFEFTLGQQMVIPGFENAIIGMNEGDTKTISVLPDDAYGHYKEDLVVVMERSQIPSHIDPKVGIILKVRSQDGATTNVTIVGLTEQTITLDGNHPLAGKELIFEVKLVEIT